MKRVLKLTIVCALILSIMAVASSVSFAEEGTVDINSILQNAEVIEEEPETVENEQETTETTNTTTTPETTTTKTTNTPETTTTETTTQTTTTTAEVVEEAKLPQTGDAENYVMIIIAIGFAGIAVYAYEKIKKYNIK